MTDSACMSVGALVRCLAIPVLPLKHLFVGESQVYSILSAACRGGFGKRGKVREKPLYAITRPPATPLSPLPGPSTFQVFSHPSTTIFRHPTHPHCITHQPLMGAMLLQPCLHITPPPRMSLPPGRKKKGPRCQSLP
ncbi:uncharacterized protein CTRU02_203759 [Colletotrichum truncatum]|uniref:Uncharacterized protein n=1 Tax=Colletotrichum truncatum TaxID=5467 RepID=A0ACC3ZA73_COLTU|nr:uncharacterized protein CTRU02_04091 [Colletotrichum truncatum]KAF6796130.1 hypothetical protein CTRU02_04091 [Colletotrichum truncatum]